MVKFEKVSYEQFEKDYCAVNKISILTEEIKEHIKKSYDNIILPKRGSSESAGYDFYAPYGFNIAPMRVNGDGFLADNTLCICTGIRVSLDKGTFLLCAPRSGLGFKTGVRLTNTVGIIDSDYYGAKNEGHIMAKFIGGYAPMSVKDGERFMQGIIVPFFTTDDDNSTDARTGGLGSSGK